MKPWCALVGTAMMNLCLEKCGDAKLIVSVSFGSSPLSRWRRQSCPDDEGHLCWLVHGDILVALAFRAGVPP